MYEAIDLYMNYYLYIHSTHFLLKRGYLGEGGHKIQPEPLIFNGILGIYRVTFLYRKGEVSIELYIGIHVSLHGYVSISDSGVNAQC
jgi:hypothetical protein